MKTGLATAAYVGSLLSLVATGCQSTPARVCSLADGVLAARVEVMQKPADRDAAFRLGATLRVLYENQSPTADEAMVVLLQYYLGEANGEDLLHNVTLRGRRMLPYLQRYGHAGAPPRHCLRESALLPPQVRADFFESAIRAIEHGEVWGDD